MDSWKIDGWMDEWIDASERASGRMRQADSFFQARTLALYQSDSRKCKHILIWPTHPSSWPTTYRPLALARSIHRLDPFNQYLHRIKIPPNYKALRVASLPGEFSSPTLLVEQALC